jgi:hypothetical protein
MTAVLPDTRIAVIPTWVSPEAKLWVASRNGEYAGMVEYTEGHFAAHDHAGRSRGTHSSLPAAQRAVAATPAASGLSLPYVAAVAGTVAFSVATMSLAALAA